MKRLLFILIILPDIQLLFCQYRIRITPYIMPQVILTGRDYNTGGYIQVPVARKKVMRYSFGINYEVKRNRLGMGTGLIYSQKGQEYSINFHEAYQQMGIATYRITTDYIEIPIYLKVKVAESVNTWELNCWSGIYLAKLIKESDNYQNIIPELIYLIYAGKWYTNHDMGAQVGLELNLNLSRNILFTASAAAEIGSIGIYSHRPWGYIHGLKESKNIVAGARIGIIYNIWKKED